MLVLYFLITLGTVMPFQIQICRWVSPEVQCKFQRLRDLNLTLQFPSHYCSAGTGYCLGCISTWETRILHENRQTLLWPERFELRQREDNKGSDEMYTCLKSYGINCGCSRNNSCSGSKEYCEQNLCNEANNCYCNIQKAQTSLVAMVQGKEYVDPLLISYQVCFRKIGIGRLGRKLRSITPQALKVKEEGNLMKFESPILYVQKAGVLILRKDGVEGIRQIYGESAIAVLDELLYYAGNLQVIFVDKNGLITEGNFEIEERKYCPELRCLFCKELFFYVKCLPSLLQYIY